MIIQSLGEGRQADTLSRPTPIICYLPSLPVSGTVATSG